jgi:imidazolonepropionase-like amidohydrolase
VIAAGPDVMSHTCYLAYQLSARRPESYQDPTPVDPAPFASGDNAEMAAMLDQMKARGIILDATTRVYVEGEKAYAAKPAGRPPRCAADLAFRLTGQAYRQGLLISAGTDGFSPWRDAYPSLHEELEYLSERVGMPNAQVIRSATLVSAMAAGRDAEMGTIEPGKLANLVFVRRDPLADIGNLRTVVFTVKRGVVYARKAYRPIAADEVERPPVKH